MKRVFVEIIMAVRKKKDSGLDEEGPMSGRVKKKV